MGVAGLLVEQDGRAGDHARLVVVVRNHVEELSVAVCRCAAVAEESFVHLVAIDRERLVLGAICSEPAAVLVDVLVAGWLIHIPDAAIASVLCVECRCLRRSLGVPAQCHLHK